MGSGGRITGCRPAPRWKNIRSGRRPCVCAQCVRRCQRSCAERIQRYASRARSSRWATTPSSSGSTAHRSIRPCNSTVLTSVHLVCDDLRPIRSSPKTSPWRIGSELSTSTALLLTRSRRSVDAAQTPVARGDRAESRRHGDIARYGTSTAGRDLHILVVGPPRADADSPQNGGAGVARRR